MLFIVTWWLGGRETDDAKNIATQLLSNCFKYLTNKNLCIFMHIRYSHYCSITTYFVNLNYNNNNNNNNKPNKPHFSCQVVNQPFLFPKARRRPRWGSSFWWSPAPARPRWAAAAPRRRAAQCLNQGEPRRTKGRGAGDGFGNGWKTYKNMVFNMDLKNFSVWNFCSFFF